MKSYAVEYYMQWLESLNINKIVDIVLIDIDKEDNFEELNQAVGLLNRFGWIEITQKDRHCWQCDI